MAHAPTHLFLATPAHAAAGAVAILQLHGPQAPALLTRLTGRSDWRPRFMRLVDMAGIDQGLAGLLDDPQSVQLMPHGGPRVVQRLIDQLIQWGAIYQADPPAAALYPEAASLLEADMLLALHQAASSAAIDLLLAQPAIWNRIWSRATGASLSPAAAKDDKPGKTQPDFASVSPSASPEADRLAQAILARSRILDRLIHAPTVVVIGRPNTGKSTLTNRLLGQQASLVADLPGTTRDWVAGLTQFHGVAVRWHDTPGLRSSTDFLEQQAIQQSQPIIARADLLIALRDPQQDWPDPHSLPRQPDLWVLSKADLLPDPPVPVDPRSTRPDQPLPISAHTGLGLDALTQAVLLHLGLHDWCSDLPGSRQPEQSADRFIAGTGADQRAGDDTVQRAGDGANQRAGDQAAGAALTSGRRGKEPEEEAWAFSNALRQILEQQDWTALGQYLAPIR